MFKRAFNFIRHKRWRKKKSEEEKDKDATEGKSPDRIEGPRTPSKAATSTTSTTPHVTSSETTSTTSKTPPAKQFMSPAGPSKATTATSSAPKSAESVRRRRLKAETLEIQAVSVIKKVGSLLLARKRKASAAANTSKTSAEQASSTIGRKSSDEDAGKEESKEVIEKNVMLATAEPVLEPSRRGAKKEAPERSKRPTRSRRERRKSTFKRKGAYGATAEPTQEEGSRRLLRSQRRARWRKWGEQEETKLGTAEATTKIAVPAKYRKKFQSPAATQLKKDDSTPFLPPLEEKSSSESLDYWLFVDGKPPKKFEISTIPSEGDFPLWIPAKAQEAKAQCTPAPTTEIPKFVRQAYGVLDKPPTLRTDKKDISDDGLKTAIPTYPAKSRTSDSSGNDLNSALPAKPKTLNVSEDELHSAILAESRTLPAKPKTLNVSEDELHSAILPKSRTLDTQEVTCSTQLSCFCTPQS